ncbi:small multi-drug export protein [Natribacillus halophilus]|uniref:Putative small multi-drug export protein n=1 Tax=Natribacillus halophilus TaxID=549003 RepID=A0A1G8L059_9BACI|nr:small multi-drug export protein [Natribacillus halophilus]SDI49001.1 Putative small multi-drug export protein [Natribacillus halophilus]
MDYLIYLLIVFVGAAIPLIEYMVVIPIGIIVGLPTIPIIIIAFLGNLATVLLLILLVDKVRELIRKRRREKAPVPEPAEAAEEDSVEHMETEADDTAETSAYEKYSSKQTQKAYKLWDKYGLPGLAILGTGLLSSHLTALMACTFGGNRAYVSIWMIISLAIWSIVTGVAVHLGMDAFFR